MQARVCSFFVRVDGYASLARALGVAACIAFMAGCDVGNKPEPPYKDPPPNQRIKSQVPPAPSSLWAHRAQAHWLPSARGTAPHRLATLK